MLDVRTLVSAALLSLCVGVAPAWADTRIFLIDSADGYGIDGCLASGAPCGQQAATSWCRVHDYTRALDFGVVTTRQGVTPIASFSTPAAACTGPLCPTVVAITCTR